MPAPSSRSSAATRGSAEVQLAAERGEVEVNGSYSLPAVLVSRPEWVRDKSTAATGLFIAVTLVALAIHYALVRKLPIMPMVSGVVVVVFGGLTLALDDELFIKLKPTIVNTLFGVVLLGGLGFGKPLLPSCSTACSS